MDNVASGARITGLNQYQQEVLRTAKRDVNAYPVSLRVALALLLQQGEEGEAHANELLKIWDRLIWTLGLAGEAGEVADAMKKKYGHGKEIPDEHFGKEFGDVQWYDNALAHSFGFSAEDVATMNSVKLRKRHPNGFTVESANAKADEAPALSPPMVSIDDPLVPVERPPLPTVFHACGARDPSSGMFKAEFPCRLISGHPGPHEATDGSWRNEADGIPTERP